MSDVVTLKTTAATIVRKTLTKTDDMKEETEMINAVGELIRKEILQISNPADSYSDIFSLHVKTQLEFLPRVG